MSINVTYFIFREKKDALITDLYPFRMPRERFYQKLGLDLVQATQNELDFLQQVDECPSLYKSSALKNAIRRYEVFWLPLAAREGYGSRFLAAPLDIAWVWHVHMLSPYNYEQDCLNCVSKIVDHVPLGDLERKRGLEKARYLWEREYSDEPFDVDLSQSQIVQMDCSNSKIQYDLERACYRQSKFYYQVSLPHYRDAKFLEKAVERYEHHVMFNKQNPGVFVVPCYDFDLIWHVHQLHPVNYNQATKRFLGQVLHHDDSATSRSPGSLLCDSEEKTRSLWKAAGLQFALPGTMYRGDRPDPVPPRSRWSYVPLARREYVVDILQVETFNMNKKTFLIQLEDPQQDEIFSHSFQGRPKVIVSITCLPYYTRGGLPSGRITKNEHHDPCLIHPLMHVFRLISTDVSSMHLSEQTHQLKSPGMKNTVKPVLSGHPLGKSYSK